MCILVYEIMEMIVWLFGFYLFVEILFWYDDYYEEFLMVDIGKTFE